MAIDADAGTPGVSFFTERNTFIFRGFFSERRFSAVTAIFDVGGEAEIAAAVVESVVVAVVNELIGRGVEDFTVHLDVAAFVGTIFADRRPSAGVEIVIFLDDMPIKFAQPKVVGGVNDSKFAFGEGDETNGTAEANSVIENHRPK